MQETHLTLIAVQEPIVESTTTVMRLIVVRLMGRDLAITVTTQMLLRLRETVELSSRIPGHRCTGQPPHPDRRAQQTQHHHTASSHASVRAPTDMHERHHTESMRTSRRLPPAFHHDDSPARPHPRPVQRPPNSPARCASRYGPNGFSTAHGMFTNSDPNSPPTRVGDTVWHSSASESDTASVDSSGPEFLIRDGAIVLTPKRNRWKELFTCSPFLSRRSNSW